MSEELINTQNKTIQPYNPPSDGLYFFAILMRYKIFIIILTLVAAITSLIIAFNLPIWFASTVNFVPPQASDAASSALGSMMKDFGLSKVASRGKSQDYSMMVFLNSRSVLDSIIKKYDLAKVYKMPENNIFDVEAALQANLSVEYTDEGNYQLTVWDTDKQRASDIANDYVKITNYVAERTYKAELDENIDYLTKRILSIDSTILAISLDLSKLAKNNKIFAPEEQTKSAATAISSLKSTALEYEIMYDFYKNNYGEDDPTTINYKELLETANSKVNDIYSKPGFIGNFALHDVTPVAVEYLTKYTDIEAFTQTKAIVVTSLEKTLLDSKKGMQNFYVIDEAIPAVRKDKPKRSFIVAGGAFGGFALSIFMVLLLNSWKIAYRQAKFLNKKNN